MEFDHIQRSCNEMAAYDRTSIMLICIHGQKERELYGEILNCYIDNPVPFSSTADMILKLDEICNLIGSPQLVTEPRFLNKKMKEHYFARMKEQNKLPVKAKIRLRDSTSIGLWAHNAKEILLICIEYRYYSSFQGRIWGERTLGKHISFRSVLELMRMINEIVEQGEEL
ncbi:MAG: hypothetical protein LBS02_03155 [Hungatella sp.]|nr:hypothetical protein [Hungatella sp.]